MGQTLYYGLSHEHPMDHLERFKDRISAIKVEGVSEDYLLCMLFKFSLAGELHTGLRSYHQDLSHLGATSKMHSYATTLMWRVLKT